MAVDGGGNVYLIGEGVYNGVIQLAKTGEFLGYFAVNDADLTFSQRLQQLLFTRQQLANLVDINPTVFTNVFVDKDGIVYTATSDTHRNGMKKHSTNGGRDLRVRLLPVKVENMDIGSLVLGFFALLGLFVACNYLVTSINDGDGTFKQIFMIPANGLMPAMIALFAVTCVSYVLTYNEAFLLTLVLLIGIIISIMWNNLYTFLTSVGKEMIQNVF